MNLSIILTVYNKEPYLRRVFHSLLSQEDAGRDDYEVLVVNDGSTDESAQIINEYILYDSRVRLLTQENLGLSMARNNGIDAAKGEYVWFVDADDVISRNSVRLICEAIRTHPEVIPIYAETFGIDKVRNEIDKNALTGPEVLLGGKWEQCGVFYVFNRSFLIENKLRFLPGIYHEDAEFTPRALYSAQTIKVVPSVLYTVYRDSKGITQVPRPKRAFDYLIVAEKLSRFVESRGEKSTIVGAIFYSQAALSINNGFFVINQNTKVDQKLFNRAFDEKKRHLLFALFHSRRWKYMIEGVLFSIFRGRYVIIYKVLQFFNL